MTATPVGSGAGPNILYLHTHDTGRMVQPYGAPVATPALQRFAEQGVTFRRAFSAAPTCSPSRAALLTGQSAHAAGMLGLAHMGWGLRDRSQHVIHSLHDAGWTSAMVGVQHVAPGPDEGDALGYHEHLRAADHRADAVSAAAVEYLRRPHERPFFLSVGFVETHTLPTDGHTFGYGGGDGRYLAPPQGLPDTPVVRADMASFAAAAAAMDAGTGRVLDALHETGLADRTIVVVTTDHGVALPGMKATVTDLGTGVMLIMRGPGLPAGTVCDALASQIDVVPTLCELTGLPRPAWATGRSLLPAVHHDSEVNDAVFAEMTFHVAYEPVRSVRTQRWRYLRRFDERTAPVLPNVDDSPAKDAWVAGGWRDVRVPREELFDELLDPAERVNLAGDPRHAEVLAQLRGRLHTWMADTGDPLLDGPVPQPAGYPYVDADATSPQEHGR